MNMKEICAIIDAWKADNKAVLEDWEVSTEFCCRSDGEVICLEVWLSDTDDVTKPREHCCDPPVRKAYTAVGHYAAAEGEMTDRGRQPITREDVERILAALLAVIS